MWRLSDIIVAAASGLHSCGQVLFLQEECHSRLELLPAKQVLCTALVSKITESTGKGQVGNSRNEALGQCHLVTNRVLSPRCPVSDDLDMIGVARQYVQLELPAFALACLMLLPHSEKRHQQIQVSWKLCLWAAKEMKGLSLACPLRKVAKPFTKPAGVPQCGQGGIGGAVSGR